MQIITLTTDFGLQDYYTPALKGAMLSRRQDLNIVDISHNIRNHDIVQAAFTLKNAWSAFPMGTIHLVSVNNFGGERNRFLVFEHQNHIFIGPDNGIFTLIFPNTPPQYFIEIPFIGLNFNHVRDAIAEVVGQLANQKPLTEIGNMVNDIVQRITLQPVILPSQIRGSVIHIDNYQNVITNITQELFEQVGRGRTFSLFFKRNEPINQLSEHYNDVPVGETLCLFNSDYLEISIHMGKASEMLGLKVEDTIQIDFNES